jgi:hypothetical protein
MKRKILFFSQGCPYPPYSGVDRRVLELLASLKELECEVTFLSTNIFTSKPWTQETVSWMETNMVNKVYVYEGFTFLRKVKKSFIQFAKYIKGCCVDLFNAAHLDRKVEALREAYESQSYKREMVTVSLSKVPFFRGWFSRKVEQLSPDVIFMVYARWHGLLGSRKNVIRITDANDLISINSQMQEVLKRNITLPIKDVHSIESTIMDEKFVSRLSLKPDDQEFRNYDQFDYTIAISNSETELIRQNTSKTKVVYIPITSPVFEIQNTYAGGMIFPTGPNHFNLQALCYFVRSILPIVRSQIPDFYLNVTGKFCCESVPPAENVRLLGHVSDAELKNLYRESLCLVNPILGGTGQIVKVVEAMAHGLPVILLECALERAPIMKHGVNGFVAKDANEFAGYIVKLWNDRDLCSRMGKAARESVKQTLSRDRMVKELAPLVSE